MIERQSNPAILAAENYEKNVATYTTGPFAAILLEQASPQPGEKVVNVACGTGIVARKTAPRVGASGTIVAVDINPAMLTVGRLLTPPEGATIDWREMFRVLRSGGRIAVCVQRSLELNPASDMKISVRIDMKGVSSEKYTRPSLGRRHFRRYENSSPALCRPNTLWRSFNATGLKKSVGA
jgi:hypothetical protein